MRHLIRILLGPVRWFRDFLCSTEFSDFVKSPASLSVFTLFLGVSTLGLFLATLGLVVTERDNDARNIAFKYNALVSEQVLQLQQAMDRYPDHGICAKYVIKTDLKQGITAEKAGILARTPIFSAAALEPQARQNRVDTVSSQTTHSLLAAVWGSKPITASPDSVPINNAYAKACMAPILAGRASPPSVYTRVAYLHREIVGYQNALEEAASILENPDLPARSSIYLTEQLRGSLDAETRLFYEASTVYFAAKEKRSMKWSALKVTEGSEFQACKVLMSGTCLRHADLSYLLNIGARTP